MPKYPDRFNLALDPETRHNLDMLAAADSRSLAAQLRHLVRQEAARRMSPRSAQSQQLPDLREASHDGA